MRAAVYDAYGPPEVVTLREVPKPVLRDDEILVRVHATSVNAGDWRLRSLEVPTGFRFMVRLMFGWSKPRRPVLGADAAGVIVEVGKAVTAWHPGQAVIVCPGMQMIGCHAEYVRAKQDGAITLKPEGVSFEEATAMCFGGTTALHFLREGKVKAGERVLIVGAAGCVGSAAVQLAKHMGAHVTGVCSTNNVELVRGLGADEVIDYKAQDFLQNGQRYEAIMDTVGTAPFARCKGSLSPGGRLLAVFAALPDMLAAPWIGLTTGKRMVTGTAVERAADLRELAQLVEAGHFKPLIGARFDFEQIVEAHRLVDSGHKRGSAVITIAS